MNNQYPTIKFTIEKEINQHITFLDLNIHRTADGKIWFDVHRKPSTVPVPIPKDSFHPIATKKMAFLAYINRNLRYTTFSFHEKREFAYILNLAIKSGYSRSFINNLIKNIENRFYNSLNPCNTHLSNTSQQLIPTYTQTIEYHPEITPTVKYLKRKYNIIVPYQTSNTIWNLVNNDRDITTPSGGIYEIPIEFNNKTYFYIGETKRTLIERIQEHKYSLISPYGNTALKQFIIDNNAKPIWNNATIITSPRSLEKLHWREAVEIFLRSDTVNNNPGKILVKLWHNYLTHLK